MELRLLTDSAYAEELDMTVDELVDQYVDGQLSAEDRERVERYFLVSEARRAKLKFALALKRQRAGGALHKQRAGRFSTFYLPMAAALLLASILAVGLWWKFVYQSDVKKGLVALQTAYRDQRPVEARISDFNYAPTGDRRGGKEKVNYVQRDRAARLLQNAVTESPSAETYHALGKYYMAERQFDKAVDQFEAALKLNPQDASIHSDLGAALLEKGKLNISEPEQGKVIEEFARGLEHLNTALELDGSALEALFNRSLLYEYMMLPKQAEENWRAYLEKDPNSKWAEEARQHLRTLQEQDKAASDGEKSLRDFFSAYESRDDERSWAVISRNYISSGNAITNALLDSYLELKSKGEDDAARDRLEALEYVGRLEFQKSGDVYTSELARFYDSSSPAQRRAIARARSLMLKGYQLFLNSKVNDALQTYAQAKETFEEGGDECGTILADYRLGHCYWFQPDLKRSDAIFARLIQTCERKNYKWLLGQSLYRTASIRLAYNEYSESIDYARRAMEQSERMQDTVGTLNILTLLADEYRSLNNERASLNFLQRALRLAGEGVAEPPQAWGIFSTIALNLNSLGLHRAALEYQKEALRLALEMKPERPLLISRSYDYLGQSYASLKIYDDALRNIDSAFEAGRKLSGQRSGLEMMANSSLHAGDVYRSMGDYDRAVDSYNRCIELYNEWDYPYFTYPARKGKLLSFIAQGNDAATEEELRTVLNLFEQYRSKLTSENQRNTFFDVEQSIYDLAIDFAQTKKGEPHSAFEYSELSRARSLLDAMQQNMQVSEQGQIPELRLPGTSVPPVLSDIERRMPPQSQIIQYAVLNNKLLIWVVNPQSITSAEVAVDSNTLGEKVSEYLNAVNGPAADAETQQKGKDLYDILIRPVEKSLDRTKLLCIVPDKILNYLPFGSLFCANTARYLVQDFRLTLSPSSAIFVECSERADRKAETSEERLLSVGDPSFDREAFPLLRRLPSAAREARSVAAFYKSSRLLLADAAREGAVRDEIRKSDVAHFALHYIADDRSELLSKMILATELNADTLYKDDDDGVWQTHEIYRVKLPQTRLVILSACQTAIEQQYHGEGAISIARPFIVAGVPLVVASLWAVDSESTERLMVSFHRYRARDHLPTADALRLAQLELIGGEDSRYRHPYYWAAFTPIGGYTQY